MRTAAKFDKAAWERFRAEIDGEAPPGPAWREEDGVIRLTVTSDGTTGPEWIRKLEAAGFLVSDYAKQPLNSPDFVSTNGVTYEVAVLKGTIFNDGERLTSNIRSDAARRGLAKPNAEVACLIRANFTDADIKAMGLWWVVFMHEPIVDSDGDPSLLGVSRDGDGRRLDAIYGEPGRRWNRESGFAFVASQVSA